jgi:prepilin-type N-terminal cleavage/methylation domain-containing protein/prepilin-type processing-associated H-X9-DG protein
VRQPNQKSEIRNQKSTAFTLVELLVVITIIGILIALLLPAVQAAREAARMLQCQNNLKQISLAALDHEQINGWLPTGGWSYYFVGDPNAGFGKLQPGGFFYNILPYMEQQALHDLALGTQQGSDRFNQLSMQMIQTPLVMYTCPSRRPPTLHPIVSGEVSALTPNYGSYVPQTHFQGDYTANGGSVIVIWPTPTTWADANNPNSPSWLAQSQLQLLNGICAQRSQVKMAEITDGASNTYLVGEKYLDPDYYFTGNDWGDDQSVYSGDYDDQVRWTGQDTATTIATNPPLPDTPGVDNFYIFGSAHASGFNMALCDGSVQKMSYMLDPEIHRRLGNRKDGLPIDGKKF